MRQIGALVWKDLRVHWRTAGLLLAGWPVGVRLLVRVAQTSEDGRRPSLPILVTMISLPLFLAVAAGLATMLVDRERMKGTFAWLRTLPLSDAHIVMGKCATGVVLHTMAGVASWVVLAPLVPPFTVPQAVSVWSATLVAGSIPLAGRIASFERSTPVAQISVLALGLLAGLAPVRWPAAANRVVAVWNGSWEHVLLWTACLAAYALLVAVAYWRFHAQDTQSLVD